MYYKVMVIKQKQKYVSIQTKAENIIYKEYTLYTHVHMTNKQMFILYTSMYEYSKQNHNHNSKCILNKRKDCFKKGRSNQIFQSLSRCWFVCLCAYTIPKSNMYNVYICNTYVLYVNKCICVCGFKTFKVQIDIKK